MIWRLLKKIKHLNSVLIERGKSVEREKAAKRWEEIIQELKNRK